MWSTWNTPFLKQCCVTTGVALNMASLGIALGYTAVILPQLETPGSLVPLDESSGSWIAATPGLAIVGGTCVAPPLMAIYGRKIANLASIAFMIASWICIFTATTIPILLSARIAQGLSLGMTLSVGPVLVGEYTSPRNRGAFLAVLSLFMSLGLLLVHTIGSFCTWQTTALVCAVISSFNLLIVLYSPESPSWLVDKGRYEDGRKVFRSLRGEDEDEELQKIIEANIVLKKSNTKSEETSTLFRKFTARLRFFIDTVKNKVFYKLIVIMLYVYAILHWAGANVTSCYVQDLIHQIIGKDANVPVNVISIGVQRLISNSLAVFVIRKFRRRVVLFTTVGLGVVVYLVTAGYLFAKTNNLLPFDHPSIGIVLMHLQMLSIATGSVPLPYIIAGELFPLEYRGIAGSISVLFFSFNFTIAVKTFPFFLKTLGLSGAYCLYAGIVSHCLLMLWKFLPETHNKTLQDIENEFRGKSLSLEEVKSVQSFTRRSLSS